MSNAKQNARDRINDQEALLPPDRLRPGSELSDAEWSDLYEQAAAFDDAQRKQHLVDIMAVLETLEEIGYFTFPLDLTGEQIAEEVLMTLEGNARDAARMQQTWTNHRGQP